jgi:hypothetical protein
MTMKISLSFVGLSVAAIVGLTQQAWGQGANSIQKLFFEGDMVRGAGAEAPGCVLTSQFKRKEAVVWRVRVLDQTGRALDEKGLKGLIVEVSDGQKLPLHFGPHPRGKTDDYFWTTSWLIPESYPTGSFSYKVVAIDLGDKSHSWEPFKVDLSQLTVVP